MKPGELDHFRSRLLDLRSRLTGAIGRMSEIVLTDDRPPEEHDLHVSEDATKELLLERSEETIRQQVVEALGRLDRGTYGTCTECGGAISRQRLQAMPYTPHCVECERTVECG